MLFNSLHFALFLPIVFILYWFGTKGSLWLQNSVLLLSSYFFYACWDWRFLFLLLFSTLLNFFTGIKIYESCTPEKKSFWLWISIVINLGVLGIFKYFDFFAVSFANILSCFGIKPHFETLHIILPIGISFYTFHGLSYVIDLYQNKIKPEKSFINYSLFVGFFPLLVAGPIERATHLLPQILKKRQFKYSQAVDGLRQILWGLFKKIVIADNCAVYVNQVFNNSANFSGSTLALGAVFFAFQIYCDFSGYSDIAIGTARLFGIDLLRNFAFPYFSRDMAEFWRRWHISLSSWFKDYLYIPLGGSKFGTWVAVRNTLIIFIVSGFWHGGNLTFIVWGILNALFILPLIVFKTNRNNIDIVAKGKYLPDLNDILSMGTTFCLTVFAFIFFRSPNIPYAFDYLSKIFSHSLFTLPDFLFDYKNLLILVFFIIEWLGREHRYAIELLWTHLYKPLRWSIYTLILLSIFYFSKDFEPFIYFQF